MNLDYNLLEIASLVVIGIVIFYLLYMVYKDITESIRLKALDERLKKTGILQQLKEGEEKRRIPQLKVKSEKVEKKEGEKKVEKKKEKK